MTPNYTARKECDVCGYDGELRIYSHSWFVSGDELLCFECFKRHDGENSFTDYPRAQGDN